MTLRTLMLAQYRARSVARAALVLAWAMVLAATLIAATGCAPGQGPEAPTVGTARGEWVQYCSCLEGVAQARLLATELSATLSGLETLVVPRLIAGADGEREVADIYIRHRDLTPTELCVRLESAEGGT